LESKSIVSVLNFTGIGDTSEQSQFIYSTGNYQLSECYAWLVRAAEAKLSFHWAT
jgi:hypothetical protein